MFNWKNGRQGGNYQTVQFWSFWHTDCYLIRCKDTKIAPHYDKVEGKRHFRLNITLWGDDKFHSKEKALFKFWRFCLFRPDINLHWTNRSSWYMLSFGMAI